MRMKKIVENRTLKSAAAEFLAFKRAQKIGVMLYVEFYFSC